MPKSTSINLGKFIVLFVLITSMLFLGSYRVAGPLTVRNVCSVFLLIYVFLNIPKILLDSSINSYLVYLLIFTFCTLISGDLFETRHLYNLASRHVPCLLICLSVPIIIKNNKDYSAFLIVIQFIFIVNSVITILQFIGVPFAWTISTTINEGANEMLDKLTEYERNYDTNIGVAAMTGLFGSPVANGYFTASFLPIATYPIFQKKRNGKIISVIIFVFAFIASICIQQRMCFIAITLLIFYAIFRYLKWFYIISSLVILIIGVTFLNFGNEAIDLGRLTSMTDDSRSRIFQAFLEFINSPDVFVGNYHDYTRHAVDQHNCFTDVIVRGGIITFIPFIVFLVQIVKTLVQSYKKNTGLLPIVLGCAIYLFYSLTHSDGVHSGDTMFWIMYAIVISNKSNVLTLSKND